MDGDDERIGDGRRRDGRPAHQGAHGPAAVGLGRDLRRQGRREPAMENRLREQVS